MTGREPGKRMSDESVVDKAGPMPFWLQRAPGGEGAVRCAVRCVVSGLLAMFALAVPGFAALPDATRFAVVLEMGDVPTARDWLDEGLDPDFMGDRIGSGLMIGAWEGNIDLMALFVSRGAQINKVNAAGEQALMHAAWKGRLDAVRWLIANGAQVNRGPRQWSALHYAAFAGHEEVVRLLVDNGADVNASSTNGSTALMMAARQGHEALTGILLDRGADARITNDRGEGALVWAMRYGHFSIAKLVSSKEEFGKAVTQPPEFFGPAVTSEEAPDKLNRIMHEIRVAQSAGLPTDELRASFWEAVAEATRDMPPSMVTERLRPRALVIRARRGSVDGTQESAELVYEKISPQTAAPVWDCRPVGDEERCVLR